MKFAFRVDSGNIIGSGHIMRCLALADYISKYEHSIIFISKEHNNYIKNIHYKLYSLPVESDITIDTKTWLGGDYIKDAIESLKIIKDNNIQYLIIDHYAIDKDWESYMYNDYKIIVIDDLHNRSHICHLLIDSCVRDSLVYNMLTPKSCKLLLGNKYIILREELYNILKNNRSYITKINKILIYFGDSDNTNQTLKVVNYLKKIYKLINDKIIIYVIVGNSNNNYDLINQSIINIRNFILLKRPDNYLQLLNEVDLCIGGCGTSSYERIFLNIPSIVISVADNQLDMAKSLYNNNVIEYVGHYDNWNEEIFNKNILNISNISTISNNRYHQIYNRCIDYIDGLGLERIYQQILSNR